MELKKEIVIKSYVMYIIVAIVMLAVVVRVVSIQYGDVVPDAPLAADSTGVIQTTKVDSVPAMRGRILACDGSDLVTSVPLYDLHVDMTVISDELFEEVDSLAINLARVFPEKTREGWESYLRRGRSEEKKYLPIQNEVKFDIKEEVDNFPIFRESQYKGGLIVQGHYKRQLPNGLLAERTLGSKRYGARPVGLEGAFDTYLTGEPGLQTKQWVNGDWKPISPDYLKDPVPGADVVTSIDIDIQEVAENELLKQLQEQDAVSGSVVLMEVETGFIRAIANLQKDPTDGTYEESYNLAVGTRTDPGSTFKLASLMALLEDGKVDIDDMVNASGEYHFYDHTTYDSHRGGYGKISVQEAFEKSSNVFSKIVYDAYQMDAQAYVNRIKSFGLADTLGLDIAGEPYPVIKNRGEDGWSGITLPQMAIGYEVELTPLQILAFYNAVANDGQLIKPQFVTEIRRGNEVIEKFEKIILKEEICSEATLEKVKACLEGVVENGTGKMLQSSNFKIAGKTGTAKLVNTNQGYGDDYQASFVGYFPADNPKYSCIVTIAGPTKEIYGAQVSGTVFTAIADQVYSTELRYHENYNLTTPLVATTPKVKYGKTHETSTALSHMGIQHSNRSNGAEWLVFNNAANIQMVGQEVTINQVPDVKGMPLNDAVFLLENLGLRVDVEGHGKVTSQSQVAGSPLEKGSQIKLVLK